MMNELMKPHTRVFFYKKKHCQKQQVSAHLRTQIIRSQSMATLDENEHSSRLERLAIFEN